MHAHSCMHSHACHTCYAHAFMDMDVYTGHGSRHLSVATYASHHGRPEPMWYQMFDTYAEFIEFASHAWFKHGVPHYACVQCHAYMHMHVLCVCNACMSCDMWHVMPRNDKAHACHVNALNHGMCNYPCMYACT